MTKAANLLAAASTSLLSKSNMWVRILGPDGEPALPAQRLTMMETDWFFQRFDIPITEACVVNTLQVVNGDTGRVVINKLLPSKYLSAGDTFLVRIELSLA